MLDATHCISSWYLIVSWSVGAWVSLSRIDRNRMPGVTFALSALVLGQCSRLTASRRIFGAFSHEILPSEDGVTQAIIPIAL